MIGQLDSDDGRRRSKAHLIEKANRMEITRVKIKMGSFLHNLKP